MTIDPQRQVVLFAMFLFGLTFVPVSILYGVIGGALFGTQWLVTGAAGAVAGVILVVTVLYVAYDEGHPQ